MVLARLCGVNMDFLPDENKTEKGTLQGINKIIVKLLGFVFLILGLIGAVMPIMPSIPFLLIAAACFFRTSPTLYKWMLNNRYFGKQLRRYHNKEGLPLYVKLFTVLVIIASFALTLIFFIPAHILWMRISMVILGTLYSLHILFQPGMK